MSEPSRHPFVIGLGANLGPCRDTLASAIGALGRAGTVRAVSSLYETEPVGPPQPRFLNAAVLLESPLAPRALLRELLLIEKEHGRERRERWGPRTLDLDLLLSPGLVLDTPDLTLPHPELPRRAFALVPLLDVFPEACDPRTGAPYREVLRSLSSADLRRLETWQTWYPLLAE